MKSNKKKKRKVTYSVLIVSDSSEKDVSQKYMGKRNIQKSFHTMLVITVLCIILCGAAIAANFSGVIKAQVSAVGNSSYVQQLETENKELTDKVDALSETLNQKLQEEAAEAEAYAQEFLPKDFPLTGSATVEESSITVQVDGENTQQRPIAIFTGTEGTTVVASGSGTVITIADDAEYGHVLGVDHGNGYVSMYYNSGDAQVNVGDTVTIGTVLFAIGADNTRLGFQITQDGVYIDPMTMVEIYG